MSIIIFLGKLLEFLFMAMYLISIATSVRLGFRLRNEYLISGGYGPATIKAKKKWTARSYALLIVLVLGAECLVRLAHANPESNPIFWIHLVFAVPSFVLATLLQFKKNGLLDREGHKSYVFGYLFCLSMTVLTATLMLTEL